MFFPICSAVVVGPTIPAAIIAAVALYVTVSNRPEALALDALDDYAKGSRKRAGFEAPVSAAECPHRPTRGRHANRRIVRKLTWV